MGPRLSGRIVAFSPAPARQGRSFGGLWEGVSEARTRLSVRVIAFPPTPARQVRSAFRELWESVSEVTLPLSGRIVVFRRAMAGRPGGNADNYGNRVHRR